MSQYANLKAAIAANVYQNHNNEVTANMVKAAMDAMTDSLGAGYQYMGIAVLNPTPTNPGTPDQRVFYIAAQPGTYTNFSGLVVNDGEVAILKWDTAWHKEVTGAATAAQVTELGQLISEFVSAGYRLMGVATTSTNPGTPEQQECYFALAGTYPYFGNITILDGKLGLFFYDNDAWRAEQISISDADSVKFVPQSLSDTQKGQARSNIDAISMDDLSGLFDYASEDAYKWPSSLLPTGGSLFGATGQYYTFASPDFNNSGKLKEFRFGSPATSAYTLYYKIFQKLLENDVVVGLQEILSGEVQVAQGQSIIDFSSANIQMQKDYVFGFRMDVFMKNVIKFSQSQFGYWWIREDGYIWPTSRIIVDFNYTIEYPELSIVDELNPYKDKDIVIMGDSITWLGGDDCTGRDNPSRGWTTYFKDLAKPKSIRSLARSGATWTHTSATVYDITEESVSITPDNVIYNQINRLINDVANGEISPNLIIIAAGTNDALFDYNYRPNCLNVSADDVFSSIDGYITSDAPGTVLSVAKAVRYDVELLKANFPNTQIILLSPLQNLNNQPLSKYRLCGDIIEGCAGYLSVGIIRQDKECGIYRGQEKTAYLNTYDGTHTSAVGAKMVGEYLYRLILSMLK